MRKRVRILAWRQPPGDPIVAAPSTPTHRTCSAAAGSSFAENCPRSMQARMSASAAAVVWWKNSNRWKSWLRLGTDRSVNISSKYCGCALENS